MRKNYCEEFNPPECECVVNNTDKKYSIISSSENFYQQRYIYAHRLTFAANCV